MKFHWKLLLAFYLPLHFAFGCFYLSGLIQQSQSMWIESKPGFSYELSCSFCYDDPHLSTVFSGIFWIAGIGLIILSVVLPSLILYRKYQTPLPKIFS